MTYIQPRQHDYRQLPQPLKKQAEQWWDEYCSHHTMDPALAEQLAAWLPWVAAISEFVAATALRYGERLVDRAYQRQPGDYASALEEELNNVSSEAEAMAVVRRFRHCELARLAIQDLLGELSVPDFLVANSALADAIIEQSCQWLTAMYEPRWGRALTEDGQPMPLVVIAMGKLGGQELNFSSDIDLIFCYQAEGETQGGRQALEHSVYFIRLGQALIKMLGQCTVDGQAFRVDMRLRPFGQSGPMAVSFSALEAYYQEQGRNWERYAMVKARYLNAPAAVCAELFQMLRPFVFRRYLDYSAIEALRKMKLLINQEARRQGVRENIKLGQGGIREVEFIAQAFQLIRGGRDIDLQTRSVLKALHVCEKLGLLSNSAVSDLHRAYLTLRKVEHVLQQIRDQQTQTLPQDDVDRLRLAEACGYESYQSLADYLEQQMELVHQQFLLVVGVESAVEDETDSELAILWQDLLEETTAIDVLTEAGAEEPELWWREIQQFRQETRKRVSGERGRELLARLFPRVLELSLQQSSTVTLLKRLLSIINKIASRTAYLDLLTTNPGALQQLVLLCEASSWIGHQIERYPHLLDELIDPQQLYDLPPLTSYRAQVADFLARIPQDDLEAQMEALRQVKQSFQLKVAAADISAGLQLMKVSDHLTYLAEAITEQVVCMAWHQLTERHGAPPGRDIHNTGFAVLAYGKLGGIELGYGSDLDLVCVCDDIPDIQTNGPKPLDAQQFYLRLAQRVLHLFTTRTLSGVLYDVDMRLRPSGNSGLMVIQLSTYDDYLSETAWTWELQALVRARMVFGHDTLQRRFTDIRHRHLVKQRDKAELIKDICAMREKMRDHLWQKYAEGRDIKQMPGGMTDIEFITQGLVLMYAHSHPELTRFTDNIRVLELAEQAGCVSEEERSTLIEAYKTYRRENHRLALAERGGVSEKTFTAETTTVLAVWRRLFDC